jgi:hypothetical protein
MVLTNNVIFWTGKSIGLTLDEYQGKFSLKGVRRYESMGAEKLSFDWVFPQEYDKDRKEWRAKPKAVPLNIYLGEKDQAIQALNKMLQQLEGAGEGLGKNGQDDGDVPF